MQSRIRGYFQEMGLLGWLVLAAVVCLLFLVFWTWFIEAFSFGAQPGLNPSGKIYPVPITASIDRGLLNNPITGDQARGYLDMEGAESPTNNLGPQAVWRDYIKWFGLIMLFTGVLMLVIKRFFEPTNDETTVMHLKGSTDLAMRAKGERG